MFLIGGFIGPELGSPMSTEVLSSNGSCNHTDGFPAPMPDARVGHVAGLIGQTVITCGGAGILDSEVQVLKYQLTFQLRGSEPLGTQFETSFLNFESRLFKT